MKKRSSAYLLLLISGIIIILLYGIRRSPFGKDNTSFAVKDGTEITRIDLIQGEKRVMLRKEGDAWKMNKALEVRKSAVQFITRTLREMKIKSPVSAERFIDDIVAKKIEPVRVNVYEKRKVVKSFFVYKTGSNIYGNIMKMRPSSSPFIVYLPGYEDNIGSHFVVDELFWQPFTVFRLLPSQIESIEFQNYNDQKESFTILNNSDTFTIKESDHMTAGYDSSRIKRYVSYFVSVAFESWASDLGEDMKKEIEASSPIYRIAVKKSDGEIIRLTVWERWEMENGKKVKDTDRVWAETDNKKGLFIMRYFDLDPVLKKKSYFFGG